MHQGADCPSLRLIDHRPLASSRTLRISMGPGLRFQLSPAVSKYTHMPSSSTRSPSCSLVYNHQREPDPKLKFFRRPELAGSPRRMKIRPRSLMAPRIPLVVNSSSASWTLRSNSARSSFSEVPGVGSRNSQNSSRNAGAADPMLFHSLISALDIRNFSGPIVTRSECASKVNRSEKTTATSLQGTYLSVQRSELGTHFTSRPRVGLSRHSDEPGMAARDAKHVVVASRCGTAD